MFVTSVRTMTSEIRTSVGRFSPVGFQSGSHLEPASENWRWESPWEPNQRFALEVRTGQWKLATRIAMRTKPKVCTGGENRPVRTDEENRHEKQTKGFPLEVRIAQWEPPNTKLFNWHFKIQWEKLLCIIKLSGKLPCLWALVSPS